MNQINSKICIGCGDDKSIDEFHKNKKSKDGRRSICKLCISTWSKEYYRKNKVKINQRSNKWKIDNPEKNSYHTKKWSEKHPIYNNEYIKNKRKNDLVFKLNKNTSIAICKSLKGNKKGRHWEVLVGYTLSELIDHLKSTIPKGHVWNDYLEGKLHLDHKIPLSIFNIKGVKSKGFKKAWELENLRFLPALENRKKSNKLFY